MVLPTGACTTRLLGALIWMCFLGLFCSLLFDGDGSFLGILKGLLPKCSDSKEVGILIHFGDPESRDEGVAWWAQGQLLQGLRDAVGIGFEALASSVSKLDPAQLDLSAPYMLATTKFVILTAKEILSSKRAAVFSFLSQVSPSDWWNTNATIFHCLGTSCQVS